MFDRATIRLGIGPHSSCKCIKVYVSQKLLKYSLIWRNYCKNEMVQFFYSQCRTDEATEPNKNCTSINRHYVFAVSVLITI